MNAVQPTGAQIAQISSRPFMIYCNLIGIYNFTPFGSNKTIFFPNRSFDRSVDTTFYIVC